LCNWTCSKEWVVYIGFCLYDAMVCLGLCLVNWGQPSAQSRSHQQQCLPLYVKPCPWALRYTTRWCFDNLGGCCWFSQKLISINCTGLHGKLTWHLRLNSSAVIWPSLHTNIFGNEVVLTVRTCTSRHELSKLFCQIFKRRVTHTFSKIGGRIEKIFWINYLWPKFTGLLAKNVAAYII
jgi:hypothetical protein